MEKEWFENENFWQDYAPVMFDETHWAEAHGVAKAVCEFARLSEKAKILDAGCGPGRISVELALLGMDVTGVDIIQSELDAALETANAEGVELTLKKADLRTFCEPEKYDAAVNLYTSFGYCDSEDEDLEILKNIFASLKKGGTFVLETTSRETAILNFTAGEEFYRSSIKVITEFSVEGAWEGLDSKWTLILPDGKKIVHEFVQRLYSAAELKKKLLQIGYSSAEVYGGYDKRPYDQNAATMVIIARK